MPASFSSNSNGGGYQYARSKNRGEGLYSRFFRGFLLDTAREERGERLHSRWLEATVKKATANILAQFHGLQADIVSRVIRIVIVEMDLAENNQLTDDLLESGLDFSIDYGDGILGIETMEIAIGCEDEFNIHIPDKDLEDGDFKPILRTVRDLILYIHRRSLFDGTTAPSPR